MHFLSHYYTALPENDSLFISALAIPDLCKRFTKSYNRILKNADCSENGNFNTILTGIKKHYEGDLIFHQSNGFLQLIELTKNSFIQTRLNRERLRLSVIAHLAVEMMIDRQIVLQQPDVCNQYYKRIENADEKALLSFFKYFNLNEEQQLFMTSWSNYRKNRYLYLFEDTKNIVYGLGRVYRGVTGIIFTSKEEQRFLTALNNMDDEVRYRWRAILEEVKVALTH